MRSGNTKGYGMLALFLITGAVLGGILGEIIATSTMMSGVAPYLAKSFPIFDLPPITINLYVIKLIFGFSLHPNLISVLGIVAAIFLFRRF